MSTIDDLRRELAELRAEFDEYRKQMAAEIRTGRLVVVDDAGAERIVSTVSARVTELKASAPADEFGERYTSASIRAELSGDERSAGREVSRASVSCEAGDAFTNIEQVDLIESDRRTRRSLGEVWVKSDRHWRINEADEWKVADERDFRVSSEGFVEVVDGEHYRAMLVRSPREL